MLGPVYEVGTLYYGGFWFPPAVNVQINARPIFDSTNRYVKWTQYDLEVEFMAHAGCDDRTAEGEPDTDPLTGSTYLPTFPDSRTSDLGYAALPGYPDVSIMDDSIVSGNKITGFEGLRSQLLQSGKKLLFTGKGFGNDFSINTVKQDLGDGPDPSILSWEPVGSNYAVRVRWGVSVSILDCADAPFSLSGFIAEWSVARSFGIDIDGLTTITQSGFVEVVNQATGSPPRPDRTAESVKRTLRIPIWKTFQRVSQTYNISPDNKRLIFSVTDREHPSDNSICDGITQIDVRERVRNVGSFFSNQFLISLSGTIRVSKSHDRKLAWLCFLFVVRERLTRASKNAKLVQEQSEDTIPSGDKDDGTKKGTKPSRLTLLQSFDLEEEIYGRSMSFGLSWILFTSWGSLFEASGIWKPIESGQSWERYQSSMGVPWSPGGSLDLRMAATDRIIELCGDRANRIQVGAPTAGKRPPTASQSDNMFGVECPPAEDSWVRFDADTELLDDSRLIVHEPIGGANNRVKNQTLQASTISNQLGVIDPLIPRLSAGGSSASAATVMQRGTTFLKVRFYGTAVRLGYAIPRPALISYGGSTVREIGRGTFRQRTRQLFNCKMYFATWDQTYLIDRAPKSDQPLIVTSPNPQKIRP